MAEEKKEAQVELDTDDARAQDVEVKEPEKKKSLKRRLILM